MPHIHEAYDFVVSVFVVHSGRVLLVHHRQYDRWLPLGGHIELNEDPDQALMREIEEESGLSVTILAGKPDISHPGVKPLLRPSFMDVHDIRDGHRHIAFVYFGITRTPHVRLHQEEHSSFRWFTEADLTQAEFAVSPSIQFYCREALRAAARPRSASGSHD